MNRIKDSLDPLGILSSFLKVQKLWIEKPGDLIDILEESGSDVLSGLAGEIGAALFNGNGSKEEWSDPRNGLLRLVKGYAKISHHLHAACGKWLREYVNRAEGLDEGEKKRALFGVNQVINALSPANCFWTNPLAVEKLVRTNGASLISGLKNLLEDFERGDHLISIADPEAFKPGESIATTPGHVIFRNELMELIQYTPATETVHAVPVVFIQAWLSKYYIVDLNEEMSMVRYLVSRGFTVLITSWKNPGPDMSDVRFEDYMIRGALKAVEVAREVCGVEQVHAVGYCVGGTVLASLMAWLNRAPSQDPPARDHPSPIKDWTLLAAMVDLSERGDLEVFISESAVGMLEGLMERDGYLDSNYMTFGVRLLRSDVMIWHYHVHNYLMGEPPPKSEFLYWSADATRLPAATGAFLLRDLCLNNNLAKKDVVVLDGRPIDMGCITEPLYAVGAEQDHICPWKGTFKICNLVSGPVRYTLALEGHVTGFVNPPSPRNKKKYYTGDAAGESGPDEWLSGRRVRRGSWWPDWAEWLSERCGPRVAPPPVGSARYPRLEKAPGSYVMER